MLVIGWAASRAAHLAIAWRTYSPSELRVFCSREEHFIALVPGRWLVINAREQSVVSASLQPTLVDLGSLALVRLDRLRGVPLGDGVKGYSGETAEARALAGSLTSTGPFTTGSK